MRAENDTDNEDHPDPEGATTCNLPPASKDRCSSCGMGNFDSFAGSGIRKPLGGEVPRVRGKIGCLPKGRKGEKVYFFRLFACIKLRVFWSAKKKGTFERRKSMGGGVTGFKSRWKGYRSQSGVHQRMIKGSCKC